MEEMEIKEMKKGWRRWNQNSINGVGTKEVEWGFFLSPAISKEPK